MGRPGKLWAERPRIHGIRLGLQAVERFRRPRRAGSKKKAPSGRFLLLAGLTGLEPATYGVTGRHSNQLSYNPRYY